MEFGFYRDVLLFAFVQMIYLVGGLYTVRKYDIVWYSRVPTFRLSMIRSRKFQVSGVRVWNEL